MSNLIKPLSLRKLFGRNYDEFITLKKAVTVMKTGKSAKKSTVISKYMVMKMILDPHMCSIVLRKQLLDHEKSTFPAIIKAFNRIQELTGYEWRKDWEVYKGAKNPHIINNRTGQIIRFVSFDRPESLAGLELEDKELYYGVLWFEEPMQIVDKNAGGKDTTAKQKQEKQSFDIIKSSAFRGTLPHDTAHREMIFSFNDWSDGDYWIINMYVKSFLVEDADILDIKGKQLVYDPNYSNGKGILVIVGTGGLNEFNDEDYISFVKEIKNTDPEFYKALWLGTAAQITGNAYSIANINRIKRTIDVSKVKEWLIGLDYSATKDYIVVLLEGFDEETKELQVVDGFRYHRGKEKYPLSEPDLIKLIWKRIDEWRIKYNFASSELKADIRIDSKDATMRSYLVQHWENSSTQSKYDIAIPSAAAKFKSSSSFIRILATRYIMGSGKLSIADHLNWLVEEFKIRTIKKDGSVQDGNDDGPQAFEYAWSHQIDKMVSSEVYEMLLRAGGEHAREKRESVSFT